MSKKSETQNSSETQPSRPSRIKTIRWMIWGILAVLVFLLASAFSRAWLTNQALRKQVQILEPMLTAVSDEQATLHAELTRVQSDTYVEQWARENAGMTQPGEILVIPVKPTPTLTLIPSPTPPPTPTPTPVPFWKTWLDLIQKSK